MRRREREKRHRENEGDESTDEDDWSGKNDEDNNKTTVEKNPPVDDKEADHRGDKTVDRPPRQQDTPRQTDRHEGRDSHADRNVGQRDGDWQNDRYRGRNDGDWHGDRHQTRDGPEYRGDRYQGTPDWRSDRHHPRGDFHWRGDRRQTRGAPHWQGDRRQFGRGGRDGDMHGSSYRRRSPSPRQYDQRFVLYSSLMLKFLGDICTKNRYSTCVLLLDTRHVLQRTSFQVFYFAKTIIRTITNSFRYRKSHEKRVKLSEHR